MKNQIRLAVLNDESKDIRDLLLTQSQVTLLWEIVDNQWFTGESEQ